MVAVTVSLPCLKRCKVLYKVMDTCSLLFMVDTQTYQMNFNRPIPMYYPLHLGISAIFFRVSAVRMYLSWNDSFVTLTSL